MVSLGLVGEVFEVRTQVDRDLTTISRVDRRLRLIKNLGRHSTPEQGMHDTWQAWLPIIQHALRFRGTTTTLILLRDPVFEITKLQKVSTNSKISKNKSCTGAIDL
jgi:hypothetical protein